MSAPLTENRKKKQSILRECYDDILDLMLYKDLQRDRINMARFKELSRNVKDMHRLANFGKQDNEKYTIDSENDSMKVITPQEKAEEDDSHEK